MFYLSLVIVSQIVTITKLECVLGYFVIFLFTFHIPGTYYLRGLVIFKPNTILRRSIVNALLYLVVLALNSVFRHLKVANF